MQWAVRVLAIARSVGHLDLRDKNCLLGNNFSFNVIYSL